MRSWHIFKVVFNIPFSSAIVVRQDLYNITKEPAAFSLTNYYNTHWLLQSLLL